MSKPFRTRATFGKEIRPRAMLYVLFEKFKVVTTTPKTPAHVYDLVERDETAVKTL